MMSAESLSPRYTMGNFIWLMDNHGGRYKDFPLKEGTIASDLGEKPDWVSKRKHGTLNTSSETLTRLLAGKQFKEDHPQFRDAWLMLEPRTFTARMVSLGYGIWAGFQALDGMSSSVLPPLARGGVVLGEKLAQCLARGPGRAGIGWDVASDIPISAEISFGQRFGVTVEKPLHDVVRAVDEGRATTMLLWRPLGATNLRAEPCPPSGSTHLLTLDWAKLGRVPVLPGLRDPAVRLVVAAPAGTPPTSYGFAVTPAPQRIELVVAVIGRVVPELRAWSDEGGLGTPTLKETFLRVLEEGTPRVAGRMLVDVVRNARG